MTQILIIEDKPEELIYAQHDVAKAGFTDIVYASSLHDARALIPSAGMILTDLFFPAGESTTAYVQRFLPAYEQYKIQRFREEKGSEVVRLALTAWAELFGEEPPTPEKGLEYFEQYTNNFDEQGRPNRILKAARDAVHGRNDYDRYQKFLDIETRIRDGTELPLGIIVAEEAKNYGIPTVIVTSTYHHDDVFEAVRGQITVPYVDTLQEGRKSWGAGLQKILDEQKRGTQ